MGMYREAIRKRIREAVETMDKKMEGKQPKYLTGIKEQAQQQSDHKQTMDMVNSPPHYNKSGIECIEAIKAMTDEGFQYYLQGNIMKYLWRYRYKNGIEDLKKAQWYLSELIDTVDDEKG